MTSTSTSSAPERLARLATDLAARGGDAGGRPPTAAAPQDPLVEILIDDIAASLPSEIAARLHSAPVIRDVHDWLAAGAMFRWIKDDPVLARTFLGHIGANPAKAGLDLAWALAARFEPPPRDRSWRRRDRLGLALQLLAACLVLVARSLLFHALTTGSLTDSFPAVQELLRGIIASDVLFGSPAGGTNVWATGAAAGWLVFEATIIPRMLEGLRVLPSRVSRQPLPLSWRTDTFYGFWVAQSVFFLVCLSGSYWLGMFALWRVAAPSAALPVAPGLILLGLIWLVVRSAASIWSLGSWSTDRTFDLVHRPFDGARSDVA